MNDKDKKQEIEFAKREIWELRKKQLIAILLAVFFAAILIPSGLDLARDPAKENVVISGRGRFTIPKELACVAGWFSVAFGVTCLGTMGWYVRSQHKKIKVEKAFLKARQ